MAGGGKVVSPRPKRKMPGETKTPVAKLTSGRLGKLGTKKARIVGGKIN
jgi:hypothetical protein